MYLQASIACFRRFVQALRLLNFVQKGFILTKGSLCLSASALQVASNNLGYLPGISRYIKKPLDITCSALWGFYGIANQVNIAANKFYGWNRYVIDGSDTYGCLKVGCFGYGTGSTAPGYYPTPFPGQFPQNIPLNITEILKKNITDINK